MYLSICLKRELCIGFYVRENYKIIFQKNSHTVHYQCFLIRIIIKVSNFLSQYLYVVYN